MFLAIAGVSCKGGWSYGQHSIVDTDIAPFRGGQPTLDGRLHHGPQRKHGHIGFAGHHDEVPLRNISIRPLGEK